LRDAQGFRRIRADMTHVYYVVIIFILAYGVYDTFFKKT